MPNRIHARFLYALTAFLLISTNALWAQSDPALELFMKGQFLSMDLKWGEAAKTYQSLLDQHPESVHAESAMFMKGFCLARIPGRLEEAFKVFGELEKRYPDGNWQEDAALQRIDLAEKLLKDGKKSYRPHLRNSLRSSRESVRNRGALALGRSGDPAALPQLEKMADKSNSRYSPIAKELKGVLKAADEKAQKNNGDNGELPANSLFHSSQRYLSYQKMLKTEKNWRPEELLDFGLWTILDEKTFTIYSAKTEAEKSRWLKIFWKKNDPTPTTEKNELLAAFEERVRYAHEHFYESWNSRQQRYLSDQYLRDGWPHAPWDARGELYVKFGEPQYRAVVAWQTEQWSYDDIAVDFMVRQYRTNIYGKALKGNTYNNRFHKDPGDREYVDANYIFKEQLHFLLPFDGKDLKGVKVHRENLAGNSQLNYHVPFSSFGKKRVQGQQQIQYLERLVVYDADMNLLKTFEEQVTIPSGQSDEVHRAIELSLKPGKYWIGLRLEDQIKNRLGIFRLDFEVIP